MEVVSRPPSGGEALSAEDIPVPASGIELLGEMSHSGFRDPPRLVRRADGQLIQVTPLLYEVLSAVDGRRNFAAIAEQVSSNSGRELSPDDVAYLVSEKLQPLGVLRDAEGNEPAVDKVNPLLALRCRFVVSKPEATNALTQPFTWLFRPVVIAAVLVAFVASVAWVLFSHGLGAGLRTMFYDPKQLLLVVGLAALSAGFHELGHAAACRYGGATPGAMGVGLYLVWPAFYTDVTDSYRLDRRGRLRTDLGGLYFNCLFTVGMVAVARVTGAESILVLVPLQLLQMVHQLLPILRLDGYHILADLTGVPDLYGRIRPTLLGALPGAVPDERAAALRTGVRRTVTAWVLIVIPVLVLTIGSAALALPRVLATAGDSISLHWDGVQKTWTGGDPFAAMAGVLSIGAILLPIAGTILIVQRITSRAWRFVWARAQSPVARAALVAAALVTALALVGALWPKGNYRPIEPGERWVVQELPMARAVATRSLSPLTAPAVASSPVTQSTEPRSGGHAGGVVEGDRNLALAVNTADGSSLFRLAFAVRSVAGGAVDQSNTAFALASCRSCSTVALAFQVVLLFDEADAITPENRAVALNVACTACLTFANATQIILGFDRPMRLTEEGVRRIDEVHERLRRLGEKADSLTSEQLAEEVAAAKEELVTILEAELVPVEPDPDAEAEEDDEILQEEEQLEEDSSSSSSSTSTSSTSTTSSTTSTTAPSSTTTTAA